MVYRKEIGYVFLNIRKQFNLDQNQMSLLMGVKKSRYSLIERGSACVKEEELKTFFNNINVDIKVFYTQINFLKQHYVNVLGVPFEKPIQFNFMLSVKDYTSFIKDIVMTYHPIRKEVKQALIDLKYTSE